MKIVIADFPRWTTGVIIKVLNYFDKSGSNVKPLLSKKRFLSTFGENFVVYGKQ